MLVSLRLAALVARKDLRIELRSRVLLNHVLPFAVLVLILFGFALDADSEALRSFAPGLFWVAVLLAALLAVGRSFALERADGALDSFRLSDISPAAVFAGKALAVFLQLVALEAVLGAGIFIFYGASLEKPGLLVAAGLLAAAGIASAGTLYGVVASQLAVRETILPLLLLPVLAPVLIGATRAFGDALGTVAVNGWSWLGLLGAFAAVYATFGALVFGHLLEEG